MTLHWWCYDFTLVVLRLYLGGAMTLPWWCYDFTLVVL